MAYLAIFLGIFGSQNAHYLTLININRFKVDGCGVSDSVFHCRQDENIFKIIFNILGPKMPILGPKNVFLESFYLTLP